MYYDYLFSFSAVHEMNGAKAWMNAAMWRQRRHDNKNSKKCIFFTLGRSNNECNFTPLNFAIHMKTSCYNELKRKKNNGDETDDISALEAF